MKNTEYPNTTSYAALFLYIVRVNIIFTPREVDVISCIVNVRGVKKIANILNLSPRTIEGHIKNILLKIGSNSQESIKDFVEYSPQLSQIKKYYIDLQIKQLFTWQIKKIAAKIKQQEISCIINYDDNNNLEYIGSFLKQAKIDIIQEPFDSSLNQTNTIVELTKDNSYKLKDNSLLSNTIFICFDKRLYNGLQEFSNFQIIDCSDEEQIYTAIFRIIKILAPQLDLNDSILKFNRLKNNVIKLKIDLITRSVNDSTDEKPKLIRKIIMLSVLIPITVISIILIIMLVNPNQKSSLAENVSVNFLLPHKNILLDRHEINKRLDVLFSKPGDINIVVLLGGGGVGKTTIARNYANKQKASIIWELNAETKNSLSLSLEKLAYALCVNNPDKQELRSIISIKDSNKKDDQILLFTQARLKNASNWFIIYDNVESIQSITQYIPNNKRSWGKGRVIITTRNSNISSNSYIDASNIIQVGEISQDEKLKLFTNITKDLSPQPIHTEKEHRKFLEQIPSFPLDVSIAAHYLKDTGMQYNKYLEEIASPKKDFTDLQTTILQDVSEYQQTRYNIISLTLQKMIRSNTEFYDLSLLLGLLDSQDIPQELLVLYKNQYIVSNFLRALKKKSLITDIQYKNSKTQNIDDLSAFSIHRSTQNNILVNIINSLSNVRRQEILTNILNSLQSYILNQIDIENSIGLKNLIRHCEALENKKDLLDIKSLSSISNSLGIIYYYLGNDKQAKIILEDNLYYERQDQETALILTHLGAIYRKLGQDYKMAIQYLEQAISIYAKISPGSTREALALTHLGNTYRTLGDFPRAAESLQKSVNIYHHKPGSYAGEARALGYLGVVYREQGNLIKAKELLEQAVNIYQQEQYPKYSSVYAGALAHLGITYRKNAEYNKAQKILEDSLEIYQQIRPKNHPDIGRNILNLGIIYGEIKDNVQAQKLLLKSLNDYETNYGKDHIETGKVLNHLGRFYTLSGAFVQAEETIKRAGNILEKNSHPESYKSFELLADLYMNSEKLHKKTEVLVNYQKSLKLALRYFRKSSANIERIESKIVNIQ